MNDQLDRLTEALADRYAIQRELGAGGMATVYLAEDLKHKRQVAVKVLRPELAAVLGAERFVQEIETTAKLQHPHILPLFDSGSAGEADQAGAEFLYYVMPFIDGETLRDKLNRETQLGIDEAVKIASDVADALDYAHRQDVIHRDIKPENILLHDGRSMVADFGIALAVSAAAGNRMTETGLSLGTPHYMSPEQATAEKEITARSDVYSLGAVLYEMLTGDPPHTGSSAQQIIMKIVTDDARPVPELRRSVPAHVADAIRQSLEKLPADRFETAERFRAALNDPSFTSTFNRSRVPTRDGQFWKDVRARALLSATVILFAVAWWGWFSGSDNTAGVRHLSVPPPQGWAFLEDGYIPALSPDGNTLVFAARQGDSTMLFRRTLDGFNVQPIEGTHDAEYAFFSPDGVWIAFFTRAPHEMRKVPIDGGRAVTVTPLASYVNDATWREDGTIVLSVDADGLYAVSEDGGVPTRITTADTASGHIEHFGPQELPDGRLLFGIRAQDTFRTAILVVDGAVEVLPGALGGTFVPNNHMLIGATDGVWTAYPFRLDDPTLGSGFPILPGAVTPYHRGGGGHAAPLAFSQVGDVAFFANVRGQMKSVTRLDGAGLGTYLAAEPWNFRWPRVSPDGTRLLVGRDNQTESGGHWILDLRNDTWSRLPIGAGKGGEAAWSRDGRRIAYSVQTNPDHPFSALYTREPGVPGSERLAITAPFNLWMSDWHPNGRTLAFYGGMDFEHVHVADIGSEDPPRRLSPGGGSHRHPTFSADGNAIAYQSDETGTSQVYVMPYPDGGVRQPVSRDGGTEPLWHPNGRELIFRNGTRFMAVEVRTSPTLQVIGTPRELFSTYMEADGNGDRGFDLMPDGSIVVIRTDPMSSPELRVIKGFVNDLRRGN